MGFGWVGEEGQDAQGKAERGEAAPVQLHRYAPLFGCEPGERATDASTAAGAPHIFPPPGLMPAYYGIMPWADHWSVEVGHQLAMPWPSFPGRGRRSWGR